MDLNKDAYGKQLLAQFHGEISTAEVIERDDNFVDFGSDFGLYFREREEWSIDERRLIDTANGRILDIGCGAGRHSLYLQNKGFDATGIDNSPGAIEVCKLRGLKRALVRPINEIDKFDTNSFETILLLGNNFGLFGDPENAKSILQEMYRITSPTAQILAATLNPYETNDEAHLKYHRWNKERGRMVGQIRLRVRFGKTIGDWFDYLFVSPEEMKVILEDTGWQIGELVSSEGANYFAVIEKKVP